MRKHVKNAKGFIITELKKQVNELKDKIEKL